MQEALAFFFTFHNVSIKSAVYMRLDGVETIFTFHNVSIKSAKIRWHHHIVMDFTFHNVSIKSNAALNTVKMPIRLYIPQCLY